MSLQDRRSRAVADCVERARDLVRRCGETPETLDQIKPAVIALARQTGLFPREHFPLGPGGSSKIYHLAQDPDGCFAIYASAGLPGKFQPPHNHTTWAVISGVYGEEHNTLYVRTDDRSTPGVGALKRVGQITVEPGTAVGLMADDFHTIEVKGNESALHLHLYGRSLEELPGRIAFKDLSGGSYKTFPANPNITSPLVSPAEVKSMIRDGHELALLDVREEGVFAKGHLLFAVSSPLSQLEVRLPLLVPRHSTRLVVCDENDGLAERAVAKLRRFGYRNISIMAGGLQAWKAAGFRTFTGMAVLSKAFGEMVEHRYSTPHITPEELKQKIDAGVNCVIFDARPAEEYEVMNIPGSQCCPGGELVYRAFDVVKDTQTLVVVNCAGRTRSILGAQSLITARLPNKVVALRNGTMGWKLAGLALEHGQRRYAAPPSPQGIDKARAAANRAARHAGVQTINLDGLRKFRNEVGERTLYVFDVRTPDEYCAGHLAGATSAPGGQLIQATDSFIGVRNARVVLADNDGIRARMTAFWLVQMGVGEVYVFDDTVTADHLATGNMPTKPLGLSEGRTIDARSLANLIQLGKATVVDLDTSKNYRKHHIPGAWFAVRSRLSAALRKIPVKSTLVFTSSDGLIALLASKDVKDAGISIAALAGGTAAWKAEGYPLESGDGRWADLDDDVYYKPYEGQEEREPALKEYLAWELGLLKEIERDGDAPAIWRFTHDSPVPSHSSYPQQEAR